MLSKTKFETALKDISKTSDDLADAIHNAGLYCLQQVNEHRNITPARQLLEAMGKKHDRQRVVTWLIRFSTMRISKGEIFAGDAKREVNPEWIVQAGITPYWELTPQPALKGKLDILAALKGVINRYNHAVEDTDKDWSFFNEDLLADIQQLIASKESNAPIVDQKVTDQPVMIHSVRAH